MVCPFSTLCLLCLGLLTFEQTKVNIGCCGSSVVLLCEILCLLMPEYKTGIPFLVKTWCFQHGSGQW